MKLLIMTPYAPYPPYSGGRMRIYDELRFLSQRHQLTLVSFYQSEDEYPVRTALDAFCGRVYYFPRPARPPDADTQAFRTIRDLFHWHTTLEMSAVLSKLQTETFDLVLLHHVFMAQYAGWFAAPCVLQEQNIESNLFEQHAGLLGPGPEKRAFRRARQLLLRQYETAMWKQFGLRIVVSENDKKEMSQRCTVGRTVVVENGINTREVSLLRRGKSRSLLFMGSLDFYPNIDALLYLRESILPVLWAQEDAISLVIAGRRPPRLLRELAADPRIQVIAGPTRMEPIAIECALTVVPMRIGSGTRIKILHSMAFGLPVVTTSLGCHGLRVENEREVLIRDDPGEFAGAILHVLNDPLLAERLRHEGRALVEKQYDSTMLLELYERELRDFRDHSNV